MLAVIVGPLAVSLLATGGCLPSRVLIDLAPGDGELASSVVMSDPDASRSSPKVALINVTGLIASTPGTGLIAGGTSTLDRVVTRLNRAADDPDVRAVVLRVNSPGGTVAASETLADEIAAFRYRTGKPIVVSMADAATSGAYYIATAADTIIAQPSTVTGSIGVIVQTFNVSEGMSRLGLSARTFTSGPNKDIANPFEPPEQSHARILQDLVDRFYADFTDRVAAARPELASRPDEFAMATDGRVFTGRQALELGLVDGLGTLRDAFDRAKSLAGVSSARLVTYHAEGRRPGSAYAAGQGIDPRAGSGSGIEVNLLQLNLPTAHPETQFLYLWAPGVFDRAAAP